MNKMMRLTMIALAAAALCTAADKTAAPEGGTAAAQPLIDAMASIGGLIASAEKPAENAVAEPQPGAVVKARSAKNSVILITGGAAAGAAAGAAMGKGSKGAMIGAALGGVAGFIYDRMTYKNPGAI